MGGEIIIPLFVGFLGILLLSYLLLCVAIGVARAYTIPTLAFSLVSSVISAWLSHRSEDSPSIYLLAFTNGLFYFGVIFGLFAGSVRLLRERRA
jgi:hypothetical protein